MALTEEQESEILKEMRDMHGVTDPVTRDVILLMVSHIFQRAGLINKEKLANTVKFLLGSRAKSAAKEAELIMTSRPDIKKKLVELSNLMFTQIVKKHISN